MLNMDNGGRIICFVEDATTCTMIRSYLRVDFRGNLIFPLLIRAYPHTAVTLLPLTNQGKVKTWLLMSAMAILRSAITVKITPNNIDLSQHACKVYRGI